LLQENIPVEEVFQTLKCTKKGLSTEEAEARTAVFGPNKLEEKKVGRRGATAMAIHTYGVLSCLQG
jgi:hypothetical protein